MRIVECHLCFRKSAGDHKTRTCHTSHFIVQVVPTRRAGIRCCVTMRHWNSIEPLNSWNHDVFFFMEKGPEAAPKKMESRNTWGCHWMTFWHLSACAHDSLAVRSRRPQLKMAAMKHLHMDAMFLSVAKDVLIYTLWILSTLIAAAAGKVKLEWAEISYLNVIVSECFQIGYSQEITAIWSHIFGC